jgi:hypothetical protein
MDISDMLRLVMPLLIGVIIALLTAFISWTTEKARMIRDNREMQLKSSIAVCKKVIDALDALTSQMKDHAWFIAWRKCRMVQNLESYPDGMVEQDQQKWNKYNETLDEWWSQAISCETELKGFFGNTGYEAFLFLRASSVIIEAASMLDPIYYGAEEGETTIPTWNAADGTPAITKLVLDTSQEGQLKSMQEYFNLMDQLTARITTLSSTMISCIQKQNVGNLAEAPVPVPEQDRDEARALFGRQNLGRRWDQPKTKTKHNGTNKELEVKETEHAQLIENV